MALSLSEVPARLGHTHTQKALNPRPCRSNKKLLDPKGQTVDKEEAQAGIKMSVEINKVIMCLNHLFFSPSFTFWH